jgi:hypothetical protein
VRYAAFMLLTATPAWLSLAESARERIVADELHPIFARHQDPVRATYYDTEAYSAKPSDVLLLEYDRLHAHAPLIDALRSCPLIAQGYFEIEQLIVGERASWLDPSLGERPDQNPRRKRRRLR